MLKNVNKMQQVAWTTVVLTPCIVQGLISHTTLLRSSPVGAMSVMSADHSIPVEAIPRREAIERVAAACVGSISVWACTADAAAGKAPVMKLPDDESTTPAISFEGNSVIPPFTTLSSGVKITDIKVGTGPIAETGRGVTVQWVLRRTNGYYVSASSEGDGEPFIYRVGDERRAIKGFDEGIRGMQTGGMRRIVVPPELAYVQGCKDGKPGPIPAGFGPQQQINRRPDEPLTFEVKMAKVR